MRAKNPGGRVSMGAPARSHAGSGCTGKVAFTSFALAQAVTRREGHNENPRMPYHCVFCRQFHLGNVGKRKAYRVKRQRLRDDANASIAGADL